MLNERGKADAQLLREVLKLDDDCDLDVGGIEPAARLAFEDMLSELDFADDFPDAGRRGELTPKQREWVERVAERAGIDVPRPKAEVAQVAAWVAAQLPKVPQAERCPACGKPGARIRYGRFRAKAAGDVLRNGDVLGGCMVGPDSPAWACRACKTTWGRELREMGMADEARP